MVTAKDFDEHTKDNRLHFRSKRMKAVYEALKVSETTKNDITRQALKTALVTWRRTDPKEYARRDRISALKLKRDFGLCTELWEELAVVPVGPLEALKVNAISYTRVEKSTDTTRAKARGLDLGGSIEDFLSDTNEVVGIVVIDMESQTNGCARRYNDSTVLENQCAVVSLANELGMTVFEINIVRTIDKFPSSPVNGKTISPLRELCQNSKALVKLGKPFYNSFQDTDFDQQLAAKKIKVAVVMGYDANVCVKNTIFGTPKNIPLKLPRYPGLLDYDITVVTSRTILASGDAELEGDYMLVD